MYFTIFYGMYYLEDIERILTGCGYSAENPVKLSCGDKSILFKKGDLYATVWDYIPMDPVTGAQAGERTVSVFISYAHKNIAATNGNDKFIYRHIPSDMMVEILKNQITDMNRLEMYCANACTMAAIEGL